MELGGSFKEKKKKMITQYFFGLSLNIHTCVHMYVYVNIYFIYMSEIINNEHILLTSEIIAIKSHHILPQNLLPQS